MTKEENIATLNEHLEHWKRLLSEKICDQSEGEKTIDALQNAIKALEQEPCDDAVSRQAAIDAIDAMYLEGDSSASFRANAEGDTLIGKYQVITAIDDLPPVTPQQEQFINKHCVSKKVCEHDKQMVLDKIRAEIDSHCSDNRDRNDGLYIAMRIIDRYKAESEDKE